jgi:hypothetical protein
MKYIGIKLLILFVGCLFILPVVSAISLSPPIIEISYDDFEPGKEFNGTFKIKAQPGQSIELYFDKGELAEEVWLIDYDRKNFTSVPVPSDGVVTINFGFKVHNVLPPGDNFMTVKGGTKFEGSGVGAVAAIGGLVRMKVPYTSGYPKLDVGFPETLQMGKDIPLSVNIENIGEESMSDVNLKLIILSNSFEELDTLVFPETFSVGAGQTDSKKFSWAAPGFSPGPYQFRAVVDFDGGKIVESERYSKYLEDVRIDIEGLAPDKIEVDTIAQVGVTVQTFWMGDLDYIATLFLSNSSGEVVKQTSPLKRTASRTKKESFEFSFDARDIEPGDYTFEVVLTYSGQETKRLFPVLLFEDGRNPANLPTSSFFETNKTLILIVVIFVLAILLLVVVIFRRPIVKEKK